MPSVLVAGGFFCCSLLQSEYTGDIQKIKNINNSKSGVQIIDGDIISDSGKNKGHYHFVKMPISEKVCALYGQKFRHNGLPNYRKELIYLGLVSKAGDVAFYSHNYANLFSDDYSGGAAVVRKAL